MNFFCIEFSLENFCVYQDALWQTTVSVSHWKLQLWRKLFLLNSIHPSLYFSVWVCNVFMHIACEWLTLISFLICIGVIGKYGLMCLWLCLFIKAWWNGRKIMVPSWLHPLNHCCHHYDGMKFFQVPMLLWYIWYFFILFYIFKFYLFYFGWRWTHYVVWLNKKDLLCLQLKNISP